MLHIFGGSDPFQIIGTVIRLNSVFMIYTNLFLGVWNKCFGYQSVYAFGFLYTILSQIDCSVSEHQMRA